MGILKKAHDPKVDGFEWGPWLRGLFRLWPAWIASIILLAIIHVIAPQQVGLLVYKTAFITWAAICGYWVYRWVELDPDDGSDARHLRRCLYVCITMLAFALAA